jgi:ankyrin repeat protein
MRDIGVLTRFMVIMDKEGGWSPPTAMPSKAMLQAFAAIAGLVIVALVVLNRLSPGSWREDGPFLCAVLVLFVMGYLAWHGLECRHPAAHLPLGELARASWRGKRDRNWTLAFCAAEGQLGRAASLLAAGAAADRELSRGDGECPLHWAAFGGHTVVLKLMLDTGADPNVRDRWGWTPLHFAAWRGSQTALALLAKVGGSMSSPANDGFRPTDLFPPLFPRTLQARPSFAHPLLWVSADARQSLRVARAAYDGDTERLRVLLGKTNSTAARWAAALHFATAGGRVHAVGWLLDQRADAATVLGPFAVPPLQTAIYFGEAEIADLLRRRGARDDQVDRLGLRASDLVSLAPDETRAGKRALALATRQQSGRARRVADV